MSTELIVTIILSLGILFNAITGMHHTKQIREFHCRFDLLLHQLANRGSI